MHVIEGAVALRVIGDRAREQLIPTGELRGRAVDIDGELAAAGQVTAVPRFAHQVRNVRAQQQCHLPVGIQLRQALL